MCIHPIIHYVVIQKSKLSTNSSKIRNLPAKQKEISRCQSKEGAENRAVGTAEADNG